MSVYVDDAAIRATVGRHNSRWSHLFADTREELHEFATRLGLRRAWFQEGPSYAKPGSPAAEMWHYDVTASKRAQAIRMGAQAVTTRQGLNIIRARAGLPLWPEDAPKTRG
ncbi:DUF4031 domain-containing protein [Nocardia sp. NPDC052278]|uniref:DUF4031 domain-containing protein n=1 Tax=unclassified Nocardia TaxID=2637762 RepID=UPI0036AB8F10